MGKTHYLVKLGFPLILLEPDKDDQRYSRPLVKRGSSPTMML